MRSKSGFTTTFGIATYTLALLSSSAFAAPAVAAPQDQATQDRPVSDPPVTPQTQSQEGQATEANSQWDIIVTATRRDTLLQETPVAVTAFNADAIEQQRLISFTDIAEKSPGLVYTQYSRQEAYFSIRGTTIGNDAPGTDLGVSVFIDDVPTTGIADNNIDLFDLQSVEVLRGPQGTLFGRNVTGGAVVVRTLPPSFEPHVKVQATYGDHNLAEVRAYVTGPINDNLAAKITGEYRRQDGLLNNVVLNNRTLSTNLYGLRGQLLWTPTDSLKVLVGGDYNDDSSPYKVQQLIGNFQPSLFTPLSYQPNDTNQGINSQGSARTGGGFARVEFTAPWGTLTSITGVRRVHSRERFSTSAEQFNELIQTARENVGQTTQEFRYTSPDGHRLSWVAGLFYLDAHRQQFKHYDLNILPGTLVSLVDPYSVLVFGADKDQSVISHSYAAFGEATYALTPELELTLGARYTGEDRSGHSEVTDTSGLSPDLVVPNFYHSWSSFTPKVSLSYQPNSHILAYATYSTGFKSGGFDLANETLIGLQTPFRPEKVKSYEAGIKLSAFEKRFVLNVAGYYADYTDLQVQAFNQQLVTFVTSNAGRAHIPGVEVEAVANPVNWLTLNGSYSYLDPTYKRYNNGEDDFSGNQIPFDAKHHVNLGAELHATIKALGGGEVRAGGDVTFQSKRYFDDANETPPFVLNHTPIRGLINLHASWTSADGSLEATIWGKNLTDRRYLVFGTDLTVFYATPGEYFSPAGNKVFDTDWNLRPAFGLTLTYKR